MSTTIYHIPFTRFSLPDGRQTEDSMATTDPELPAAYDSIRAAGFRMTVEILGGIGAGMISAAIECPDGDYDQIIHPNGPGLPDAIGVMMKQFDSKEAALWREMVRDEGGLYENVDEPDESEPLHDV